MLLDYVDGPLARAQGRYEVRWVYLDHMAHQLISVLFIFAVTVSYYNSTQNFPLLIMGFSTCLAMAFNNIFNKEGFLAIRFNRLIIGKQNKTPLLSSFLKTEEPINLFLILIILNLNKYIIIIYGVAYTLSMGYKLFSTFRTLKNERQKIN